jgi:regulator of sigma E protease
LDENAKLNSESMNTPASPAPTDGMGGSGEPGQADRVAEVSALKAWLKYNMVSLIITAIVVVVVCVFLDVIDTVKVVLGLGLVIFIHELGHFLAAKWCDVHVKTFSIGFGPAVPFCSYKWGETTYMVGIIPLGGYVSMVGEGDNAADDDAEEDPRSFRRKSVGQRMLIISAGVVMNIILGLACFAAAYLHGVNEEPATVGGVASGGAAWRAGIRADDHILKIDDRDNPTFQDLRPIVMSTRKGNSVKLLIKRPGLDEPFSVDVEPLREEGTYFPTLGIFAEQKPTLLSLKKKGFHPTIAGTIAAKVEPQFEPGDRIVGMTDPNNPAVVTPLQDPREPANPIDDYYQRLSKLGNQPITFHVRRKDAPGDSKPVEIVVPPAYRADLGIRMRIGEVMALRKGSPAENAGVIPRNEGPNPATGDRIAVVKLPEADGKEVWFTTGDEKDQPNVTVRKLDPILLPLEIKKWAERNSTKPDLSLKLVVLRTIGHKEGQRVELTLKYDSNYMNDRETVMYPNSPISIGGLGLGYWVEAVVEEVAPGGPADSKLQKGDLITAVRLKSIDSDGKVKSAEWDDVKAHQWALVESKFQSQPPYEIDLKVKRGEEIIEINDIKGREDKNWPLESRGLILQLDYRTQKAGDFGEALNLGSLRTVRFIKIIYMNLYSMIIGRVSPKTMSGPLTIATASYRLAGEDFWQFLLFLGMISVNLAVVNFLPIPVLDGGHMVFLILEKILGRPVPERIFAFAMYVGLALILSLMVYVIYLDVSRLF